jgi:hypothetical protein
MALGLDIGHDKRNTSIYPLGIVVGAPTTIYSCLVKNLICDLEVGATKK